MESQTSTSTCTWSPSGNSTSSRNRAPLRTSTGSKLGRTSGSFRTPWAPYLSSTPSRTPGSPSFTSTRAGSLTWPSPLLTTAASPQAPTVRFAFSITQTPVLYTPTTLPQKQSPPVSSGYPSQREIQVGWSQSALQMGSSGSSVCNSLLSNSSGPSKSIPTLSSRLRWTGREMSLQFVTLKAQSSCWAWTRSTWTKSRHTACSRRGSRSTICVSISWARNYCWPAMTGNCMKCKRWE